MLWGFFWTWEPFFSSLADAAIYPCHPQQGATFVPHPVGHQDVEDGASWFNCICLEVRGGNFAFSKLIGDLDISWNVFECRVTGL